MTCVSHTRLRRRLMALTALAVIAGAAVPGGVAAQGLAKNGARESASGGASDRGSWAADAIAARHLGASRSAANRTPRSETDQAVSAGWPLYRTERGQEAFNDAMATLAATRGAPPPPGAFGGCVRLDCPLSLPKASREGWLPAGRLWVSPKDYVVIAHSPRQKASRAWRRRSDRGMRVFVFHEFHNSSRNTDPYDTISSHKGAVFVPFYMSKTQTDADGRQFVVVVQVAPYDVVSVHATNRGSAGPGIEVAKNVSDEVEPLQTHAGILVATMVTAAVPRLQVVNHRGREGLDMLRAYDARRSALARSSGRRAVTLPFVPAPTGRVAAVSGQLGDLIARGARSRPLAVAERSFVPQRAVSRAADAGSVAARDGLAAGDFARASAMPRLVGPIEIVRQGRHAPAADATPRLVGPILPAVRPARANRS